MTGYVRAVAVAASVAAVATAVVLTVYPAAQSVALASATRSLSSPAATRGLGSTLSSAVGPDQPSASASTSESVTPSVAPSPSSSPPPTPSPSPSPAPSPSAGPVATAFSGTSAIGALFTVSASGQLEHFCTGAVVYSPHGNLVVTAAHCIQGRELGGNGNVIFAPGYHDGHFPHGKWQVMSAFVDKGWQQDENPNDDVAFLIVGRHGRRIEKYTGAESLQTNVSLPQNVQVVGYPDGSNEPVECSGTASALALPGYQQLVFDCDGYTDGTSGGPFLMNVSTATGLGVVIGVIGGYELGGLMPDVSYSSEFLKNVASLYARAEKV